MKENRQVKIKAYAKINTYLDVLSKRSNGYHNIKSIMQTIDLCDTLDISLAYDVSAWLTDSRNIKLSLSCTDPHIPTDGKNLVCKAVYAFYDKISERGYMIMPPSEICVTLVKNIPHEAGMGGGSADCAAMLRALNELEGRPFQAKELIDIGAALGADVPFCIVGGTAIVGGIGEEVCPVESRAELIYVTAKSECGISTPRAFALLDEKYNNFSAAGSTDRDNNFLKMCSAYKSGITADVCGCLYNIFENVIADVCPDVPKAKQIMTDCGAYGALLSGSGPSVVGYFEDNEAGADKAAEAVKKLTENGYSSKLCHGAATTYFKI